MEIITLLNEKGGVGKTTLAVNIATELAFRGQRVLLVDCDPQANATISLQIEESPAIYDLLVRDAEWSGVTMKAVPRELYEGDRVRLHVVPGNIETRSIPIQLTDIFKLDTRLRQLDGIVDIILIDTPPTPSLFHNSILLATDKAILPTKLESLSIKQLVKTLSHMQQISDWRQKSDMGAIDVLGIVPTMYRSTTLEHRENLVALEAKYAGKVWEPIVQRTVWAEASHACLPVRTYFEKSEATGEIERLVNQIVGVYA